MYVQIIATVEGRKFLVDDVFVYGHWIPADGTFRRITYLSWKHVALVGANVAVNCTNNAGTPDCSLPTGVAQPTPLATTTTRSMPEVTSPATEAANCSGQDSNSNETTNEVNITREGTITNTATSHKLNCTEEKSCLKLSTCVGVGTAAGSSTAIFLTIILSFITCCLYKKSMKKG